MGKERGFKAGERPALSRARCGPEPRAPRAVPPALRRGRGTGGEGPPLRVGGRWGQATVPAAGSAHTEGRLRSCPQRGRGGCWGPAIPSASLAPSAGLTAQAPFPRARFGGHGPCHGLVPRRARRLQGPRLPPAAGMVEAPGRASPSPSPSRLLRAEAMGGVNMQGSTSSHAPRVNLTGLACAVLAQAQPSLLPRHLPFEERRWIIGNGFGSPESPSGHLPARPAQRHLPRTLPAAEPPAPLITPQTMLGGLVHGVRRNRCPLRGRENKAAPVLRGWARRGGCSLLAHPRCERGHPQSPGAGGLESCVRGDGTRPRCLPWHWTPWPGGSGIAGGTQPRAQPGASR